MSDHITAVTNETWDQEVSQSQGAVLVYFWAPWCGHCKMFAPVFDELAQEYTGKLKFVKVNCDENAGVASRCQIMGTPTLLFYKNGEAVDRVIGGLPKPQIVEKLDALLAG